MTHEKLCPQYTLVTMTIGGGDTDSTIMPKVCCCYAIRQTRQDTIDAAVAAVEALYASAGSGVYDYHRVSPANVIAAIKGVSDARHA